MRNSDVLPVATFRIIVALKIMREEIRGVKRTRATPRSYVSCVSYVSEKFHKSQSYSGARNAWPSRARKRSGTLGRSAEGEGRIARPETDTSPPKKSTNVNLGICSAAIYAFQIWVWLCWRRQLTFFSRRAHRLNLQAQHRCVHAGTAPGLPGSS